MQGPINNGRLLLFTEEETTVYVEDSVTGGPITNQDGTTQNDEGTGNTLKSEFGNFRMEESALSRKSD